VSRRTQQTIPEAYLDLMSLHASVVAMKEILETLTGQRNHANDAVPTWQDLVELGLIQPDQVPKDVGLYRPK
jgi:hypothetical protein